MNFFSLVKILVVICKVSKRVKKFWKMLTLSNSFTLWHQLLITAETNIGCFCLKMVLMLMILIDTKLIRKKMIKPDNVSKTTLQKIQTWKHLSDFSRETHLSVILDENIEENSAIIYRKEVLIVFQLKVKKKSFEMEIMWDRNRKNIFSL